MRNETDSNNATDRLVLVLGGTGKTGRRIAAQLAERGVRTRIGSRSARRPFDWADQGTWDPVLEGVTAAYVNYAPDLAIPGAKEAIRAFVDKAVAKGVQHLVLLSGRGEEEAQACERIIQEAGVEWTVVRASWFNQNFSEGEFLGMVQDGVIALPAADIPEPFVDVNDIADVVVAALTEEGHAFEVYEVTGPRMLTFAELAKAISVALGREVQFVEVPRETFSAAIADSGAPQEIVWLTDYLFSTVLDGRNAYISDGIERALGRPPRDFSDFAREIAATGVWEAVA